MKDNSILRRSLVLFALAAALICCALAGCGEDNEQDAPAPVNPVVSAADNISNDSSSASYVEIVSASDFITAGTSLEFAAECDGEIVWSSSDESIATVDSSGVVTGVSQGQVLITAASANGTVRDSSILRVARSGLIFLSPSRQTGNIFAVGNTTECEQAFAISGYLEKMLLDYGCEVYVCPEETYLIVRSDVAKEMNAICYVAIHTNAGESDLVGTTAMFHPSSTESISLALALYNEVAELTPSEEVMGPYSGMGRNFAEIREPYRRGIPSTLLEVEFHDKPEQAQWIIDHPEEIADAIATGIMKWLSEN